MWNLVAAVEPYENVWGKIALVINRAYEALSVGFVQMQSRSIWYLADLRVSYWIIQTKQLSKITFFSPAVYRQVQESTNWQFWIRLKSNIDFMERLWTSPNPVYQICTGKPRDLCGFCQLFCHSLVHWCKVVGACIGLTGWTRFLYCACPWYS